jgi:hypothetical protein
MTRTWLWLLWLPLLLFAGCELPGQAPDPAKIQRQVEVYRQQELELVSATIGDAERANQFRKLIAERDALIARSTDDINGFRERMAALNADYHAGRGAFDSLLAEYNARRAERQAEFIDLTGRMKAQTTAAEWKEIAKFQAKRLNPRVLVYGSAGEEG